MDYLGKLDGVPFEGGEGRDQLLELGSGRLIPGFEEQLVGAKAGDERLVEVTFPEEYGADHLAGKPATFEVKVTEVKTKRLPELDDDFASDAAGFDTLAELREDIATRLAEQEEHTIEHEFERDVIDAVADGAEVEIPHQLVHGRAHEMVEETIGSLARQGISKEMYLQISGSDRGGDGARRRGRGREDPASRGGDRRRRRGREDRADRRGRPRGARAVRGAQQDDAREADEAARVQRPSQRLRSELASRQAVAWLVEQAKSVPHRPRTRSPRPRRPRRRSRRDKAPKKPAAKKPAAKKPAKPAE